MAEIIERKKVTKPHRKIIPQPLETNRNYSVSDGAAAAGVAAITFWRAIYSGNLETYRAGRRRIVSGAQIQAWLEAGGKTSNKRVNNAIAVAA